ncbi:hypothetical protein VMCG_05264 [Cytospora schulzeri]|uniref:Laccase n=1 Tax=Cytospora schulzeri TaxID=448051 RepID=A0A423WQT9_9PEZI|nr:hypothetical protein VMCG_05264 [Valsa malicola]
MPRGSRRHMDMRAPFASLMHLFFPGRQVDMSEKMDKENDCFEEIPLVEARPGRRSMELRTCITSITGLILAILSFVFGVGCGLGIGMPYYGTSLSSAFSRPSKPTFNRYGVPDDLPVIPTSQLINTTELDLATDFTVSSGTPSLREYVFNITHALAAPDGFWKPMILVNNQSPGPLIEANTGDTVRVTLNNHMPNASTSVHFHGIDQRNTTWMDGVASVSQCGVPPGGSWTYEFVVEGQRGTFWYHSHAAMQYTDGLYGPIVVHDPGEEVPPTDGGRVVFLGANYHSYAGELADMYLAPSSPWDPKLAGVEPLCDNFVMNGQGVADCGIVSTTYNSSTTYKGEPACTGGQMYTTTIKPGTTLRLRLINHSSYLSYWFSIDSHNLTIVEIDGIEIEPITSRGVHVNIGQRYSVIVNATGGVGDYYMRQTLERDCFLPYSTYNSSGLEAIGYQAKGILRYERPEGVDDGQDEVRVGTGAEVKTIGTEGDTTNPWGCGDMPFDMPVPKRREEAYKMSQDDPSHIVDYQFRQVGEINRIFINKTSWSPYNSDAVLWQAMDQNFTAGDDGGLYHNWGFRLDQQVLLVPDGSGAVQVAINSLDAMEHPFHMHGHSVQVVGWGPGRFDPSSSSTTVNNNNNNTTTTAAATTWNLANPLRRDTFTVPAQSHVVIRFLADNPGVWVLHCHVAWHLEAGMLVSFIERPGDLKTLVQGMDSEMKALSQSFCGKRNS